MDPINMDIEIAISGTERAIETYEKVHKQLDRARTDQEKKNYKNILCTLRGAVVASFENLIRSIPDTDVVVQASTQAMRAAIQEEENDVEKLKLYFNFLRGYIQESVKAGQDFHMDGLPQDIKDEIEKSLKNPLDSKTAYVNDSPVVKKLMRPETERMQQETVSLSNYQNAAFSIIEGYLDPYEVAILEEIGKFKILEKQQTVSGKTFCTVGQLYRALRGGGNQSPTNAQRKELMRELSIMAEENRKIGFKMSDYVKIWGGFESNGGKFRIISYDEYYGKIKGQEETLIVFDDTIMLHLISERLKMFEVIPQSIKAVRERYYTITLLNGEILCGNRRKLRVEMSRRGIEEKDIVGKHYIYKKMAMSRTRIAVRTHLLKYIVSYMRARSVGTAHSNKIPYAAVYKACGINTDSRESVKRTNEDIQTIMEHFQNERLISSWKEYTNRGSRKPDGIEIYSTANIQ